MQPTENCLESIAVVFDDADYTSQSGGFPGVEIIQQLIR